VTWSKSGTDESFFSITSGGVLTITGRDFETPVDNGSNNTYVVIVTATDSAGNTTSQTLTVTITNVNEAPMITVASSATTAYVSRTENTTVIYTYTGSDSDTASNLTWSISGTDVSFFSIDSFTGALAFLSARDFEAPADSDRNNTYVVTLTLSDGALTDSQTLTVTVTNVNESGTINAPTISGVTYKGVVTTITVTSNVAGKVRFFVSGKRISGCLSRATTGSYPNVTATCPWKPVFTGQQNLTATLTPSDKTFSTASSNPTLVSVLRRTGPR
jgi:VCBS repeat-containing protein